MVKRSIKKFKCKRSFFFGGGGVIASSLVISVQQRLAHQFSSEVESLENSRQRMVHVITYSRWSWVLPLRY